MEFLLNNQWIIYTPGLALLAYALLRLLLSEGKDEGASRREDETEPRVMVVRRVPSVFDRKDRKSGK